MKGKAILATLAITVFALAAQDTVKFTRVFKEGDKDRYTMHVTMSAAAGDAELDGSTSQLIKKVYENGDADIEITTTEYKLMVGGNEMAVPTPPVVVVKYDKHGSPIKVEGGPNNSAYLQMSRFMGNVFDQSMKVGDTIKIDFKDEKEKSHTTGTVTLDSVTNGEAKLTTKMQYEKAGLDTPFKADSTITVDTATGKMNTLESKMTNMPPEWTGGYAIESSVMSLKRVK